MSRFAFHAYCRIPRAALTVLPALAFIGVAGWSPALAQTKDDVPIPEPPAPLPAPNGSSEEGGELDGPRAVFVTPHKNFGELWAGTELTHVFTVKNTGTKTLKILKVKASCGCTQTGYDKQIAPGAEGKISTKLRTRNFNGKFSKIVTVTTNDPDNTTVRLELSGIAKQHITVEPRTANFKNVQPDETLKKTVTITNNSAQPLELTLEQVRAGPFTAVLTESEPGKSYTLEITGNPPYRPDLNRETFHLATNVPTRPKVDVMCIARVPPRLGVQPTKILLGAAQQKETRKSVRFTNNGKTAVNVTGVEVSDPKVTVAVDERDPGKDYFIDLVFPPGYLSGEKGERLVIKTDDSQEPTMTVPIVGPKRKPGKKLVGKPAPKVIFETVDGRQIATGVPSDEILVLEFYVSWCPHCKRTLPDVEKLHQKYKGKGVRVVAVSEDGHTGRKARTEAQIAEYFEELNLTMERVLDPQHKLGNPYKVRSYPAMYLLGKNGVVEALHSGAKRDLVEVVSRDLDLLLEGKSPSAAKTTGELNVEVKSEEGAPSHLQRVTGAELERLRAQFEKSGAEEAKSEE